MQKSVKKNYLYNLSYQILAIILPVVTAPYLARTLGPSGTGTYSYTISIVTYFILFGSLGINLYGQREIAYYQNDQKEKNKIFTELFILKFITLFISAIIFYLIFCLNGNFTTYYKILLIEMFGNMIDISWLYQGLEDFKKIAIRNFIVKILSVISIFLFIKTKNDIWKYVLIYTLTTLFGFLSMWYKLKKYVSFVSLKSINIIKHIKPTIILFIPQIAIQIYTVLDKTMIGAILHDMTEVGYYEQSQKIIKILLTIITSLGTVMLPRIASKFSEGDEKSIKEYLTKSFNMVFMLGFPLTFGLIAVANNFVPLFFGKGYDLVIPIMQIMSVIILFIGLSNVIGMQYLLPTKRQKEYTTSVVVGAIVNLILNVIFIPIFGSVGAAIGTIIAELSVTLVQMYFVRNDFKILDILKSSIPYLIASSFMFIICLSIMYINISMVATVIVQLIIGSISYFLILCLFKEKFLLNVINQFFRKFKESN